ncbi:MAG: hypothetical protein WDA71_09905 [Actinomycetota bacterium]
MRRPFVTLVVCLGLLAGAAGCGQRGSTLQIVKGAPAAALEKGSARMVMDMTMTVSSPGQPAVSVEMHGEGVSDLASERGHMTFRMTLPGALAQAAPGTCEFLQDQTTVYVKVPPARAASFGGKQWAKADASQTVAAYKGMPDMTDPTGVLDFLASVGRDVETLGTESVRGARTTHYRAKVDYSAFLEQYISSLPEGSRQEARRVLEQSDLKSAFKDVPVDAWIDDQGLPRRMQTTVKLKIEAMEMEAGATMEMYDYGVKVELTMPSDAESFEVGDAQTAVAQVCYGGLGAVPGNLSG